MEIERRALVLGAAALATVHPSASSAATRELSMYGLIGKMTAKRGRGDELAQILLQGVAGMPGCLSYVVATNPENADFVWIMEVWTNRESHAASLSLPSVRDAITKGRPLIDAMETVSETVPLGGSGLRQ